MKRSKFQIHAADIIRQMRNQSFSLQSALLEMIDNSIDAGASCVSIKELNGDLFIEDDGHGFDDIERAFSIGGSEKFDHIGRYGIGMKSASIKYSTETIIESNNYIGACDWERALRMMECPDVCIDKAPRTVGSKITWKDFRNFYSTAIQTHHIQRTYALGIQSGLYLEVNGQRLCPLPQPKFTHFIKDLCFEFQGKPVRLQGGIYPGNDPQRKHWQGYNVFYRGRLIGPGNITEMGTGDSNCTNFSFILEIEDSPSSSWCLSTHKDELEGMEELLDFIYNRYTCKTLRIGEEREESIDLKELEEAVEGLINAAVTGNIRRGPREKFNTRNSSAGKGSPKRNTFTNDDLGPYATGDRRARHKQLAVQFGELGGETLGELTQQKRKIIFKFNLNNAFVAGCRKAKNPVSLSVAALMTYSQYCASKDKMRPYRELLDPVLKQSGEELTNLQKGMEQS